MYNGLIFNFSNFFIKIDLFIYIITTMTELKIRNDDGVSREVYINGEWILEIYGDDD